MSEDDTFMRITNKDIYCKLEEIGKELVVIKNHVIATNGKVKVNRWIATTALSLTMIVTGWFIGHLIK